MPVFPTAPAPVPGPVPVKPSARIVQNKAEVAWVYNQGAAIWLQYQLKIEGIKRSIKHIDKVTAPGTVGAEVQRNPTYRSVYAEKKGQPMKGRLSDSSLQI
ncbi:hypothetical protein C8J56DRAFT_1051539 [Mycena floridula]|nr:hypothetical protein C8J56DRAFT_1051539 [Mycena floridula]